MAGYGAGNRAPQFYQTFFNLVESGRAATSRWNTPSRCCGRMRKCGDPLSTADAISVTHHAGMLAGLRGRCTRRSTTSTTRSSPAAARATRRRRGRKLQSAMDTAGIGNAIGKVTVEARAAAHRQRLPRPAFGATVRRGDGQRKADDGQISTSAKTLDARRSAFLHRVGYLKVPFAGMSEVGGDFSGTIFREHWQLKWDPRTEPAAHRAEPLRRHHRSRRGSRGCASRSPKRARTPDSPARDCSKP